MDFVTTEAFETHLQEVQLSPKNDGALVMIVKRPAQDERVVVVEAELSTSEGLVGDNWNQRASSRTSDGGPHPEMQLNVINSRVLNFIAGGDVERMQLAGDQLVVDFDLSATALAPWTRLIIGNAVIEVTDQPHTGCAKFSARFGIDARRFVNTERGRAFNLRGINAKVVQSGTIRVGDRLVRVD